MNDSEAIALLCAPVGDGGGAAPLTPAKWAELEGAVSAAGLEGPGALAGLSAAVARDRVAVVAGKLGKKKRSALLAALLAAEPVVTTPESEVE